MKTSTTASNGPNLNKGSIMSTTSTATPKVWATRREVAKLACVLHDKGASPSQAVAWLEGLDYVVKGKHIKYQDLWLAMTTLDEYFTNEE